MSKVETAYRPLWRLFRLVLLAVMLSAASGCGLIDYFFLPQPEDTAQEIYESGMNAMAEGRYSRAAETFGKLRDRFPFSPYATEAELGLADSYFLNRRYDEAIVAYKEFEALHPRDENIPYVLYQIGEANLKTFRSIDRPMTQVSEALEYFTRLEQSYPNTTFAAQARAKIVECRKLQAEHELYIADFYWRSGRYGSAWKRYSYVAESFSELPEVNEYANYRSQQAYLEYQKEQAKEERAKKHGSWRNWFDWL